ncbi:MAG TPA: chromosome segregation protein SMC [Thermoanaerobaculia bacterium]|nr:chromosome segregation protein SMC [Thermoanaerobaculia bacterium]HUM28523.1 chromosome segregation protein SMC [Thermoanaerobaculia bacterium]HXK66869.1 chromosome segregation protein SMC [Thermoanaerobaculia bacterium]
MPPRIIISRLNLNGYKSFPDKTDIRFDPGVSIVVGPNGCGKSNVCEAVAWVLGSQSPKEFRTQAMADVIFAGTRKRKALGLAEVSITFYSGDSSLPGAAQEMEVSRRVFQDGGGEYRIDGKVVRLKDLLDLLGDTGFNYSSYSIISQGQVEAFVQMRGTERRQLIEEAAGIARFREKKRQTVLKLEETRGNLQRIEDILQEKEKQLHSLKVQAGRARRYRDLESRVMELQRLLLFSQFHQLTEERLNLEGQYRDSHLSESKLSAELGELEKTSAEAETALLAWNERASSLDRDYQEKMSEISKSRALIDVLENQIQTLAQTREQIGAEIGQGVKERHETGVKLARLSKEITRQETHVTTLKDALATMEQDGAGFDGEERNIRTRLEEERHTLVSRLEKRESLNARLVETQASLSFDHREWERVSSELMSMEKEIRTFEEEKSTLAVSRKELEKDRKKVLDRIEALDLEHGSLTESRERDIQEHASLSTRIDGWETTLLDLEKRIQILQDQKRLPALVEMPDSWEPFADTLFHLIAEASLGEIDSSVTVRKTTINLPEIEGATPLNAFLKLHPEAPSWLLSALPGIYLVEEKNLDKQVSAYPHVLFFSSTGSFAWGGLRGSPPYAAAGTFSETIHFRTIQENLEKARKTRGELESRISKTEKKIEETRSNLADTRDKGATVQNSLSDAIRRSEEVTRKLSTLRTSCAHLREARKDFEGRNKVAETSLGEMKAQLTVLDKEIEETKVCIQNLSRDLESKLGNLTSWRSRLQEERSACQKAEMELMKLQEEHRSLLRKRDDLDAHTASLRERDVQTEKQIDLVGETRTEQTGIIEAVESTAGTLALERERLKAEGEKLREKKTKSETSLREVRHRLDSAREQSAQVSTRLEVARVKLQEVAQRSHEIFHVPPGRLEGISEEISMEDAQSELDNTRNALQRLGAVNLLAEEEFTSIESDVELIRKEKGDLVGSLNGLNATAQELEQTAQRMFLDTYSEVNRILGTYIENLFRGGHGELRLLDEENPLESGVDIFVQPPGKRLQNMLLLSGGEKALAALALLMALFRFRPSPFLILDEVDAALDDANVERFIHLVEEVRSDTQVILITHNRRTMDLADLLLGVTMEEPGCSKVITLPTTRV